MKYDFAAIEKKWQDKWEEEKPYAAVTGDPSPKFYGLIEFPYPSAAGPARRPSAPLYGNGHHLPQKADAGLQRPATPSASTPSACRRRTSPSRTTSIPPSSRKQNIENFTTPAQDARLRLRLGPRASTPPTPTTTSGRSGSSCRCSSTAWPTRPPCPSTGARAASACWPTRRSSRACASAAAATVIRKEKSQWMLRITEVRRPPDRRSGRCGLHRARQDPAAQLDRPLHRRRGHLQDQHRATTSPSTPPVPIPSSARPIWSSRPSTRCCKKWQPHHQELGRGRRLSGGRRPQERL